MLRARQAAYVIADFIRLYCCPALARYARVRTEQVFQKGGQAMTITLNIRPEVQAALARQAATEGRAIETVAASLLEEAVHLPAVLAKVPAKDMVELFAPLRGLNIDFERDSDLGGDLQL